MEESLLDTPLSWIADSTPDYIIIINSDYEITYVNRVLEGLTKELIIGYPLYLLVKPEDQLRVKNVFDNVKNNNAILTYETDYQKPDGSMQYFESLAKPLILQDEFKGISISSRDITEKKLNQIKYNKLMQNNLNQKEAIITILEKNYEELSQFALIINHDIKNFVNAISLFANLELESTKSDNLTKIIESCDSIKEILDNALDFAKEGLIVNNKFTEFSLTTFLNNLANVIIPFTKVDIKNDLPTINSDQIKIMQIFKNIFDNAVTHGKANKIIIDATYTDDYCLLSISNDGLPIAVEKLNTLFKGEIDITTVHGNGLKIVKKLVHSIGWSIALKKKEISPIFEIMIPSTCFV